MRGRIHEVVNMKICRISSKVQNRKGEKYDNTYSIIVENEFEEKQSTLMLLEFKQNFNIKSCTVTQRNNRSIEYKEYFWTL